MLITVFRAFPIVIMQGFEDVLGFCGKWCEHRSQDPEDIAGSALAPLWFPSGRYNLQTSPFLYL